MLLKVSADELIGHPIGVALLDDPDKDLDAMDRDALLAAARAMRRAIRTHRDASGHDLCWHQPDLWALLPDKPKRAPVVPDWPQFLRGCVRYRQSLDDALPDAPRTTAEFKP